MWTALSIICLVIGSVAAQQAPDEVNINAALRDASVSWDNNNPCPNVDIDFYELRFGVTGSGMTVVNMAPRTQATGTGSAVLVNLTPCTNYTVEVRVNCTDGTATPFSSMETFLTDTDVPSAPFNLTSENQTNSTIDLAWDAPVVCGDTVESYNVTFNGQTISTGSNSLTFQLTDLAAFTNYTINITAINIIGAGEASNTIVVQTLENFPFEPQNLIGAALTATSVGLRWEPPEFPNGILTQYIVKYSNGSMVGDMPYTQVVDAGSLSANVINLMNNTNYTFAISAANSAGNSTCINETTIMTPDMDPIAPSAPVNLRSVIQPTSIKISWDPPIRLTNFAYYIVAFISPPSNDTVNVTEPCANVGPLLPETMYTCSCTPFTSDGVTGEAAVISGMTTTPMLMMPMNVTATPTSTTTINVQWVPPSFVNTIDHYFISWEPFRIPNDEDLRGGMEEIQCASANTPVNGMPNCTDVMEFDITGLEEFINYRVMVIASNDVGNSTSGTATARTLPAIPDAIVQNINITEITYNSVSLYWEMIPFLNQNGPDIRYIITLQVQGSSDPPRIITRAPNTAFIRSLSPLTTYEFFITASNSEGNAMVMSQTEQFTTLAKPPGAVSNIMVSPNSTGTEANITWVGPDVGVDVVYSVVITNANNDIVWTGSGINTTNIMATGLEPFILYTVTITPSTTGGSGPPLSRMFYTREEVPAVTVGNIQGRIDDNGLTVTFTPLTDPNDARGNVSYIVCYMQVGSTEEVCQTTTDSSVTFPGSFSGSLYSITVTPATTVGAGTQSAPISVDGRDALPPSSIALIVTLCVVTPIVAALVITTLLVLLCLGKCKGK